MGDKYTIQKEIKKVVHVNDGTLTPTGVQQVANIEKKWTNDDMQIAFWELCDNAGDLYIEPDGKVAKTMDFYLDGDDLLDAVQRQQRYFGSFSPAVFDDAESEAHRHLMTCMNTVTREWQLNCNVDEFAHAIHVIQWFIKEHMLQRIGGISGSWYDTLPKGN